MATLRELRDRIKSVNSTKKITKAQELIATSKITKAQARVTASQPYADEITRVIQRLASASSLDHPMLDTEAKARRAAILVITSDRGMCGGYNHNVLKTTVELRRKLQEEGKEVVLYIAGSKGVDYFNFRDDPLAGSWTGFSQDPVFAATADLRQHLIDGFTTGPDAVTAPRVGLNAPEGKGVVGFDELHVVYTRFQSMLTQTPQAFRMLPIETRVEGEVTSGDDLLSNAPQSVTADFDFEPDPDTLLAALLPQYVSRSIFALMLESAASESAARRTAMSAATDNATALVNDLSRVANQLRQAKITQEISEIVGGVDALSDSGESD